MRRKANLGGAFARGRPSFLSAPGIRSRPWRPWPALSAGRRRPREYPSIVYHHAFRGNATGSTGASLSPRGLFFFVIFRSLLGSRVPGRVCRRRPSSTRRIFSAPDPTPLAGKQGCARAGSRVPCGGAGVPQGAVLVSTMFISGAALCLYARCIAAAGQMSSRRRILFRTAANPKGPPRPDVASSARR